MCLPSRLCVSLIFLFFFLCLSSSLHLCVCVSPSLYSLCVYLDLCMYVCLCIFSTFSLFLSLYTSFASVCVSLCAPPPPLCFLWLFPVSSPSLIVQSCRDMQLATSSTTMYTLATPVSLPYVHGGKVAARARLLLQHGPLDNAGKC